MYVITHHHDYDEVLLGPIEWNSRFIASVLRQDLDLNYTPTIVDSDANKVPYDVLPNVRIRRVESVAEEFNPKTQFLVGPYWSYTDELATATYKAAFKDIDIVKSELKQELANERYNKEVSGTKVNIQGKEITADTNRGSRDVFAQKYLLMSDTDTVEWKFPEGWLTLTKTEMGQVVTAINNHVQNCFNWESQKTNEIDSGETHDQLNAVVIKEVPQE